MKLIVRQPSAALDAKHYTTERLRSEYVIETVFAADEAVFTYSRVVCKSTYKIKNGTM